jgi:hypothetical protein
MIIPLVLNLYKKKSLFFFNNIISKVQRQKYVGILLSKENDVHVGLCLPQYHFIILNPNWR